MALLIEPANRRECARNEKERKLMAGEFVQKSREEYMMQHIGLIAKPAKPQSQITPVARSAAESLKASAARRRRQGTGVGSDRGMTPLRAASLSSLRSGRSGRMSDAGSICEGSIYEGSQYGGSRRAVSPAPSFRSGRLSTVDDMMSVASDETVPEDPMKKCLMRDPVQEVMMKGPPLFSPAICSMAATRGFN